MYSKEEENITDFSLKTILITIIGIILFIGYIDILRNGENSLSVLNSLKDKKENLLKEKVVLKKENQILQKAFFQLKQLEAKE